MTLNHGVEGSSPSGPTKGRLTICLFIYFHNYVYNKTIKNNYIILKKRSIKTCIYFFSEVYLP